MAGLNKSIKVNREYMKVREAEPADTRDPGGSRGSLYLADGVWVRAELDSPTSLPSAAGSDVGSALCRHCRSNTSVRRTLKGWLHCDHPLKGSA